MIQWLGFIGSEGRIWPGFKRLISRSTLRHKWTAWNFLKNRVISWIDQRKSNSEGKYGHKTRVSRLCWIIILSDQYRLSLPAINPVCHEFNLRILVFNGLPLILRLYSPSINFYFNVLQLLITFQDGAVHFSWNYDSPVLYTPSLYSDGACLSTFLQIPHVSTVVYIHKYTCSTPVQIPKYSPYYVCLTLKPKATKSSRLPG